MGMDIKKISEVEKIEYTTVYSYGGMRKEQVYVSKHADVLDGVKKFTSSIKCEKPPSSFKGKKVYFLKSVTFSRDGFLKKHEGAKLSRIENADIIVIDTNKISVPSLSRINLVKGADGVLYHESYAPRGLSILEKILYYQIGYYYFNWNNVTHNELDRLKMITNLYEYRNKKSIIDVSSIILPSTSEFTFDIFRKVMDMLSSNDVELRKLALNIMCEFDVDENKDKYAVIFALYASEIRQTPHNVEVKTLLQVLSKREVYLTGQGIQFWIKLSINNPDDDFMIYAFNQWLKTNGGESSKIYKLIEYEYKTT